MPEAETIKPYCLHPAQTAEEREAVYTFRYLHYYCHLAGAPGVDHAAQRVYSPHDEESVHLTGCGKKGELFIVGTGTRASTPNLPTEWKELLCLERLAPLGLDSILIFSRLVEHSAYHGSPAFADFFKYAARYFTERGYAYSIHYCAPAVVPLYERIGFRVYGGGYTLPSGLYRTPMLLLPSDTTRLGRTLAAFSNATEGVIIRDDLEKALALLPELATPPLCAMSAEACLALVRAYLGKNEGNGSVPAASVPDSAGRLLRRAAIFPLQTGDSPIHANDDPLLWFLLEGYCRAVDSADKEILVRPGMFINAYACKAFTAMEPGRVLFFTPKGKNFAAEAAVLPPSFWSRLV